jgi:hypothetical protein
MERQFSYKGHDFTIRADPVDGGYTEAIAELGRHMSQPGYSYRETSEWDGSGAVYATEGECIIAAIKAIEETVDDEDA